MITYFVLSIAHSHFLMEKNVNNTLVILVHNLVIHLKCYLKKVVHLIINLHFLCTGYIIQEIVKCIYSFDS